MRTLHPPSVHGEPALGPRGHAYRGTGVFVAMLMAFVWPLPALVVGAFGWLLDRALGSGMGATMSRVLWGRGALLILDDEGLSFRVAGARGPCVYPWAQIEDLGLARHTPRTTLVLRLRGRRPAELDLADLDPGWIDAVVAARTWLVACRSLPETPAGEPKKGGADADAQEGCASFLEHLHALSRPRRMPRLSIFL